MQMTSVLDPIRHRDLMANIDRFCETAGISQYYVAHSARGHCTLEELEWLQKFRAYRETHAGLVLTNPAKADTRMMYMCGALLRNYIDARMYPLNSVLKMAKADELPEPTVLMIPNVYVAHGGSTKGIPAWEVQALYDILLERFAKNKPTVMFIEDMNGMAQAYGSVFADHIRSHYKIV
ncbi:hypothetical protein WK13_35005 [Burkholderia ubonensis]|nr:hypothetical protein WK13_35005 [Burkholderia ubonensis]